MAGSAISDATFRSRVFSQHGDKVVPLEAYKGHRNAKHKFRHTCGHTWETEATNVMRGSGCPNCHKTAKRTREDYETELASDGRGLQLIGKYVNRSTKAMLRCRNGHMWNAVPAQVKHYDCPQCVRRNHKFLYSRKAIEFIELVSKASRLKFQHAENGGEHRVTLDGKPFAVDGFNKRYNIALEFHGDSFHGNPKKFAANDNCHPFKRNVTAQQLLAETRAKERKLRKLGYAVIAVWESEFSTDPEACVQRTAELIENAKEHPHLQRIGYGKSKRKTL